VVWPVVSWPTTNNRAWTEKWQQTSGGFEQLVLTGHTSRGIVKHGSGGLPSRMESSDSVDIGLVLFK